MKNPFISCYYEYIADTEQRTKKHKREVSIMKNIISKLTGKKALTIVTVIACICTLLEIATAIRTGSKIDFFFMGGMFAAITAWACEINNKEKAAFLLCFLRFSMIPFYTPAVSHSTDLKKIFSCIKKGRNHKAYDQFCTNSLHIFSKNHF